MAGQRIVRRGEGYGASGFTDFDGDVLTIGQRHDDRRAGYWRTDSGGVGDGATFSGGLGRRQFHGRGVDGIGDFGHGRNSARHQVFEVATGSGRNRRFDFAGVFVDVIGRSWNGHGASGFTGFDGDYRAVRQGHRDWRACSVGQGCGVDDRTTFRNGAGRSQRQIGGVDGVGDIGRNRRLVRHQIFEVAAAHLGDRIGDRRVAGQCVIRRGGGRGAGGLANTNGDGLTVSQGHDHR